MTWIFYLLILTLLLKSYLSGGQWVLHKIDLEKHPNAKCLDGSPGGYWFFPGTGDGKDKFIVHHQGGGWCSSSHECYDRAKTSKEHLGSSDHWVERPVCDKEKYKYHPADRRAQPCHADGGSGGLFSFDPAVNHQMYNWNKVYVGYCDGSSFSSRKIEPVQVTTGADESGENGVDMPGKFVYFQGHYILDAVYDMFLVQHGMMQAREIVISGSSAGGLAVINHLDYLNNKITKRSKTDPIIVGIIDGGYFMDVPSLGGTNLLSQVYKSIYLQQDVVVNHKCMKFYENRLPLGQGWKCLMPQYSLKFIETPLFLVQSFVDAYQVKEVMDLSCIPGSEKQGKCTENDYKYLKTFRSRMMTSIQDGIPDYSGYWLVSCTLHTITNHDHSWIELTGKRRTLRDTVLGWYETYVNSTRGGEKVKGKEWVEVDGIFDPESSCHVADTEEAEDEDDNEGE